MSWTLRDPDPRMLPILLLYGYCVGFVCSRKIERACRQGSLEVKQNSVTGLVLANQAMPEVP